MACQAALLRLPGGTVLAGPSAAYLHGVQHAARFADDVHVITPTTVRLGAQRGLRVHHLDLPDREIALGSGPPRTTPARTAWEVAAWLDKVDLVTIVDSLLAMGRTSLPAPHA